MQETKECIEYVNKGFRILIGPLVGFEGMELTKKFGDNWWDEVLKKLSDQEEDLIKSGTYAECVDSLDIANCIRILDRFFGIVFKDKLSLNCRSWAKELMSVRNLVSHKGQQDISQRIAERALDTMYLLCSEIDKESAEQIKELYTQVRGMAGDKKVVYIGPKQPMNPDSFDRVEDSLFNLIDTDVVQRTDLTRKITFGGKTETYPVYKVSLDVLKYNDQNDRIATWISRYEAENGKDSLSDIDYQISNGIIENFIYESNPTAIKKTQNNIQIAGQRVPGVTLADGRVVDGNRRFTCLRRLQRTTQEPLFFETVIMDANITDDRKNIKLLELAIQHGEEEKVDYDLIDYAIGTYRDVVQTKLITIDEYAESTNELASAVKKRIAVAELICEFLEYIKLPEAYHVARDYQVYSLFQELHPILNKLDEEEKAQLKKIAFNNTIMNAIPDQRKFIRDINKLVKSNAYKDYFKDQSETAIEIEKDFSNINVRNKNDIDSFAEDHATIRQDLQASMEKALTNERNKILQNKPYESAEKSIELLLDIDMRIVAKLDDAEKQKLKGSIMTIKKIVENFEKQL